MLRFTLFGIPVEIQPWFWVTSAVFGGAIDIATRSDLFYTLTFVLVALISIMVHEFGHALTGRRLAGGMPKVTLWAFGGLASNQSARFTRDSHFWMIFMGPGAGFLLLLSLLLILSLVFQPSGAASIFNAAAFSRLFWQPDPAVVDFLHPSNPAWWFVRSMIWVNFWWSLINLLPVLPLDGGQITNLWVSPQAKMLKISMITGIAMALVGALFIGSLYVTALFGYLAYRSYEQYKRNPWG